MPEPSIYRVRLECWSAWQSEALITARDWAEVKRLALDVMRSRGVPCPHLGVGQRCPHEVREVYPLTGYRLID